MKKEVTIKSIELTKKLRQIFPKNGYYLISLQEKIYIWERNADISKDKPFEEIDSGIKINEKLSSDEKKYYENLYGNKLKPENITKFNLEPKLIESNDDATSKILILGESSINLKGQKVLKFIFLNFREYSNEELEEKQKSEQDFINALVNSFYSTVSEEEIKESSSKIKKLKLRILSVILIISVFGMFYFRK